MKKMMMKVLLMLLFLLLFIPSASAALSPPRGLTYVPYFTKIDLRWTPVSGANTYYIYRSDKTGIYKSTQNSNFIDKDVLPGKTYYYKVASAYISATGSYASAIPSTYFAATAKLLPTPTTANIVL